MSVVFLDVDVALRRFEAISVGDAGPHVRGRTVTAKLGPFGWERPIARLMRQLNATRAR